MSMIKREQIMRTIEHIWGYLFRPEDKQVNFGEELRKVAQSRDFSKKLDAAAPFLIGSLVAWPAFWMYKGMEWNKYRGFETLPVYIRRTFFQAKMIQMCILTTGILVAITHDPNHTIFERY